MKTGIQWGHVSFGIYGWCDKARFLIQQRGAGFVLKKRVTRKRWIMETVEDVGSYTNVRLAVRAAQAEVAP